MYACCRITWCLNARTYWCWQENSRESAAGPTSDQKPLVAAAVDHSPSSSGSGDVVRSAVSDCTLHFYFSTQSVHGARGIMFLHCSPICVCMQYTSINPPVWWYMEIHEVSSNHWARWLKWLNSDPVICTCYVPKESEPFQLGANWRTADNFSDSCNGNVSCVLDLEDVKGISSLGQTLCDWLYIQHQDDIGSVQPDLCVSPDMWLP